MRQAVSFGFGRRPDTIAIDMKRVLLSWSSGKDSAWTLHLLRQNPDIELVGLLTTLNTEFQRVAMHGTRRSVLEAQAEAARLPLWIVPLPWPCSQRNLRAAHGARSASAPSMSTIDAVAFGDLVLAGRPRLSRDAAQAHRP